ncbi:MAG: lipid II flippase Amj family protein [Candidatus Eremiobacteraeota bacterium]|nr:lipid II flippase Amj family protein [Candidatus Eremiobacteraeota bacterium]
MAITFIVQGVTIGAYAARLSGVLTGRIATSISLFNLFVTFGRLANIFTGVTVGPLTDGAAERAKHFYAVHDAAGLAALQSQALWQLRLIVAAGTVGMLVFALLLPMFIHLFQRGVKAFERRGSIPHALFRLGDPTVIRDAVAANRFPTRARMQVFSAAHLPKKMLVFNLVITAVYSIGVVSSYYASLLDISAARTALGLSGVINGVGTILFTLFVDPTSSMITDEAVRGVRPVGEVRSMVFYLALTAIAGTLVSQLILWPSAKIIELVAHFFTHIR